MHPNINRTIEQQKQDALNESEGNLNKLKDTFTNEHVQAQRQAKNTAKQISTNKKIEESKELYKTLRETAKDLSGKRMGYNQWDVTMANLCLSFGDLNKALASSNIILELLKEVPLLGTVYRGGEAIIDEALFLAETKIKGIKLPKLEFKLKIDDKGFVTSTTIKDSTPLKPEEQKLFNSAVLAWAMDNGYEVDNPHDYHGNAYRFVETADHSKVMSKAKFTELNIDKKTSFASFINTSLKKIGMEEAKEHHVTPTFRR